MSKNQKGKGLGRGIDALFMNDLDTIDALEQVQDSEQIQQIAVSEIRPNPYQPRKEFDEEGLAELAESFVKMESSNQSSFVSRKLKATSLWLENVACVRLN